MFSFECQSSLRFHHKKMCFTYITILIVLPVSVKSVEVKVVYGKPHVRIDMRLLVCQFFLRFHRMKRQHIVCSFVGSRFFPTADKIRGGKRGNKIGPNAKSSIDYKDFTKEVYIEIINVSGPHSSLHHTHKIKHLQQLQSPPSTLPEIVHIF